MDHHPNAFAADDDKALDTTVVVLSSSPAAAVALGTESFHTPSLPLLADIVGPWRGAWATAFSGVRSCDDVVESGGFFCCYSTTAPPMAPVDAPLQAVLPRDVAAMVLLMLKDDILQPVAIDAVVNGDIDTRPNWSRAVKLPATRAVDLELAAQMAPRLRVVECDGDPAELSVVLAHGCAALRGLTDIRVDAGVASSFSPAVSLSPIAEYLTRLQVWNWRAAADLDVLARCVRLRDVELISCGVTSADVEAAFGGSAALRSLSLCECSGLTSLACVVGCTGLETLDVSGTSIVDFAPLGAAGDGALCALRSVTANGIRRLVTAQGLAGLPALTTVSLLWCPALRDVTDLARCHSLASVRLTSSAAIESVDSLAAKTTLTALEAKELPCVTVKTVGLLSLLPRLKWLALDSPTPAPAPSYPPLPGSFPALLRLSVKAAPNGDCYPDPANIPTLRYFNGKPVANNNKPTTSSDRHWYRIVGVGFAGLVGVGGCMTAVVFAFIAVVQV